MRDRIFRKDLLDPLECLIGGILRTLIARPGKVCTRDHLMNEAYELHKIVSDRTIDSHVRRVRSKLASIGADPIETVHGIGYKLGSCQ